MILETEQPAPVCQYCDFPAVLVSGDEVYPQNQTLHHLRIWVCGPCDAYVGTHPGTDIPLGDLADRPLRGARIRAHEAFDPVWRAGYMKRQAAYGWLASRLGIEKEKCHIAMFSAEQCEEVVRLCRQYLVLPGIKKGGKQWSE